MAASRTEPEEIAWDRTSTARAIDDATLLAEARSDIAPEIAEQQLQALKPGYF